MTWRPRTFLTLAVCCVLSGGPPGLVKPGTAFAEQHVPALSICETAGTAAERSYALPAGLLLAIGRVESGRWDDNLGRVVSWPWTINAAGKGQRFDTKEEAIRTVSALLESGTRSIDIGCFQISLLHHPLAFPALDQGFDPEANANYAARFLTSLFARTGTWEAAVQAYHSADPIRGFAYRQQVFATWTPGPATAAASPRPGMVTQVAARSLIPIPDISAGVQVWTPMPPGMGARIVAMPPPVPPAVNPMPVSQPTVETPATLMPRG